MVQVIEDAIGKKQGISLAQPLWRAEQIRKMEQRWAEREGQALYALMERAHLAVTPGRDFGASDTGCYIRFSTANAMEQLQEAVQRMRRLFA